MKRCLPLFYALLFAAPAYAQADGCRDWQSIVLPADHVSVEVSVDTLAAMLPAQPTDTNPDFLAEQTQALDEARDLLRSARHPLPLGNITGAWRIASIQVGRTGGFSYPSFAGRIERKACGYRFIKTQGSQRRSGVLLPMQKDAYALAFLGSSTVNENPGKPYGPGNRLLGQPAGPDGPVNSAGRLLRIAPNTLLMILDASDNGAELYRLER